MHQCTWCLVSPYSEKQLGSAALKSHNATQPEWKYIGFHNIKKRQNFFLLFNKNKCKQKVLLQC